MNIDHYINYINYIIYIYHSFNPYYISLQIEDNLKNSSLFFNKQVTELFGGENIEREVLEPFKKLQKFLVEEYMPNTRPGYVFSEDNKMFEINICQFRDSKQQSSEWKGVLSAMSEVPHLY